MSESPQRRLWQCPACSRSFKIPLAAADPKLCPRCANESRDDPAKRVIHVYRVAEIVGCSAQAVLKMVGAGDFPAPVKSDPDLGTWWIEQTVLDWKAGRQENARSAAVRPVPPPVPQVNTNNIRPPARVSTAPATSENDVKRPVWADLWAICDGMVAFTLRRPGTMIMAAGALAVVVLCVGLTLAFRYRGVETSTPDRAEASARVAQHEAQRKETATLQPEQLYSNAVKSVVVINGLITPDGSLRNHGSGFILADRGVIITNEHVIRGTERLTVKTHDGKEDLIRTVLAVDESRDIAVLPLPFGLKSARGLKVAGKKPRIGETVFAIGSPKGLEFTLTRGIVSQLRSDFVGKGSVIQTDVSISPGSSGGPLLNRLGEVVGINRLGSLAAAEAHNLNFAVAATELDLVLANQKHVWLTDLEGYKKYHQALREYRNRTAATATKAASVATELKRIGDLEERRIAEVEKSRKTAVEQFEALKRRGEQARKLAEMQADLTRLNRRIVAIRLEIAGVDRDGTALLNQRSKVIAQGRAVYVAGIRARNDILTVRARMTVVAGAIQRRQIYLRGGQVPIDEETAGYNAVGVAGLQSEQSLLTANLVLLTKRAQTLEASFAALDLQGGSLLLQIQAKAQHKVKLVAELESLKQQYASLLPTSP